MALSFQELIRFILDGQNVDAATINRVLRDLDNNTRYVKDMFDAALSAEALFDRDVSCEDGLLVGMPAYYNAGTHRYERAKAATYFDNGLLKIAESSYPWGICSFKHNSSRCDLLLCGVATVDIMAAIKPADVANGDPIPGVYYLSGSDAGFMQRSAAPVSVPILQAGPDDSVYVRPNLADIFTRHTHYQQALVCKPAGTANLAAGRWSINAPDATKEGWLPVNASIFAGKAPAGAVFGYNLSKSALGAIWPPMPLEGVYVAWDRGVDFKVAATGLPLGPYGLVTVDANGIWWNSDVDLDVPWPPDYATAPAPPAPGPVPETPRLLEMRMAVYFSKPVYQTSDTVVTSLTSASPSLSITCDGKTASSGALVIKLDAGLAIKTHDDPKGIALKTINALGEISDGPVVVGIKPLGLLAGASADPIAYPPTPDGYLTGKIDLTVAQVPLGGELPIIEVKLDGATLEEYKGFMSLGLLADRDASFRGEYHIPKVLPGPVKTRIRLWLLGRVADTLPPLTLHVGIIGQPAANHATQALPSTPDALTAMPVEFPVLLDTYIEVESDDITVNPGDAVQFTVARSAGGGDGYDGDVLVLKRLAVIV